jgi:hypothetical protein
LPSRTASPPHRRSSEAVTRLWSSFAENDVVGDEYLQGRYISNVPRGIVKFNIGLSGDPWLDAKAHLGYRIAVKLSDAMGTIVSIALRFAGTGEPPDGNKILNLAGVPSAGLLFALPTFWAGAELDDPLLVVEGLADFLSAAALTNALAEDRGPGVPWPFGLPGSGMACAAIRAFGAVFSGRRIVLALDADDAGRRATFEAAAAVRGLNSSISFFSYPSGVKDLSALVARLERGAA